MAGRFLQRSSWKLKTKESIKTRDWHHMLCYGAKYPLQWGEIAKNFLTRQGKLNKACPRSHLLYLWDTGRFSSCWSILLSLKVWKALNIWTETDTVAGNAQCLRTVFDCNTAKLLGSVSLQEVTRIHCGTFITNTRWVKCHHPLLFFLPFYFQET